MTGTGLAISSDQEWWDDKQLAALKQLGLEGVPNGDLAVFLHVAQRSGLDPFAKQIHLVERQGRCTIQTGIDGFRLVARRATDQRGGVLGYEDPLWCGPDGQWTDVWLASEPPTAAKATVLRDGGRFSAVALFSEYAARKRDGQLTQFWATKPALMLAKCAEALALRKAFPQDLSGIYSPEEMEQADNDHHAEPPHPRQAAPAAQPPRPTKRQSKQAAPSSAPAGGRGRAHPSQLADIAGLIGPAKLTRAEALAFSQDVVGRPLVSAGDLTMDEASAVIAALRDLVAAEQGTPADVVDAELVEPPLLGGATDAN